MKYVVKTLGCKANLSDSQRISADLASLGFEPVRGTRADRGSLDLVVINSCTVTDEADRQSRKMAERFARENPNATVVFTGCAAEVEPEKIAATPGVHFVIGNQDKHQLSELLRDRLGKTAEVQGVAKSEVLGRVESYKEMTSRHPMDRDWPLIPSSFDGALVASSSEAHRTRAFLKIQDGCDAFCTYCIIPYGRGKSRSLSIDEVVSRVSKLVTDGYREVVITGINLGDYGVDWSGQYQMAALLRSIFEKTTIERLRVSSLDPTEVTPEILAIMRDEPRFCAHFHVSLQSPHSRVLRLMKRKYDFGDVKTCLESIADLKTVWGKPFVGMDVITGFPGETDEEAEWSYEALRNLPWTRLHVFPYSERAGTPATRLPGVVPKVVRQKRADRLRELSLERMESQFRAQTVSDEPLLLENEGKGPDGQLGWVSGYTPTYRRVWLRNTAKKFKSNELARVSAQDLWIDRASGEVAFISS